MPTPSDADTIEGLFRDPPRAFYPTLMWFWNADFDEDEIRAQIIIRRSEEILHEPKRRVAGVHHIRFEAGVEADALTGPASAQVA